MTLPMPPELEGPSGAFICSHFSSEPILVPFGQERCRVLFQHHHSLQGQVCLKDGPRDNPSLSPALPSSIPVSCRAGKTCVAWLAQRSLAWLILHLDTINNTLAAAERALLDAYAENNLDTHSLQTDFKKARRQDRDRLKTRLRLLANKDASTLTANLLKTDDGNSYPIKELTTAFTMRVRALELMATEAGRSSEVKSFLHTAAMMLQRLSKRPPDYEIPLWCITSLDVTFDADDGRLIGRGAFGRVVEGEWMGMLVAVKELSHKSNSAWVMDTFRHEVQIWSRLSHPNILPFYGACLESSKPFIISKLCKAGNALRYIQRCPNASRINLLHDISVGMVYLHDQGIIHADLKASNILIGDAGEALIADFGLSQVQDQVSSSVHVTRTSADKVGGTFRWMAPEVLLGKGINKPADLYSFALTVWEFYTNGEVPFGSVTDLKVFSARVRDGERPERPASIDDEVWGVVQKCWRSEPCERPDFVEVEKTLAESMRHNDKGGTHGISNIDPASQCVVHGLTVDVSHLPRSEETSPLSIPKARRASISATTETDGKTSFLKGLVNRKILTFSKSSKVSCMSPKPDAEQHPSPSDELGFSPGSCKIPSLARLLAESPNSHTMDAALSFLYNHSLSAEGVSEILDEPDLVPAVLNRLLRDDDLPENERYLMSGILANLACHANGRNSIASQAKSISALRASLAPVSSTSVLENATRCLYNLSTDNRGHRLIAASDETIAALGRRLYESSMPANIIKNMLGCFTNLSHKEPGRSAILSAFEALEAVIYTLRPGMEDITREQALMCVGNLSVHVPEKGVAALLVHPKLISGLSACLCEKSPTPAIRAQALRCLRNLAKSAASHAPICSRSEIMSAVCDVLAVRASSNHQKYALHFLHRIVSSEVGKAWLRSEKRVFGSLRWFVDNGFMEEQVWAKDCLKEVQDLL
ncbi:hypothetical protein D9615_005759 [Tricholomella constricta]|uniref:Protein kinase domain-containing protein n=1 Tax=Tricholomella constricta TaxID=117010 RepID=A0A8H5HAW3_9AGAR|nr:hypothetical protein D9615_005759 [Tricholomella constricta]